MTKPPKYYYAVVGVLTLWALIGCYAYLAQVTMSAAELAALPPAQRDMMAGLPTWISAVYAIAVWSALAGAIGLMLRMKYARSAYVVSLVAIIVQFGWTLMMLPIIETMGFAEAAGFPIFIAAIGVCSVWFAGKAARHGWLR